MYENIIAIHNVLKKKTIQLNFQPAQYLKTLAKIILKQKNFLKKKQKKEEEINFGNKRKKQLYNIIQYNNNNNYNYNEKTWGKFKKMKKKVGKAKAKAKFSTNSILKK